MSSISALDVPRLTKRQFGSKSFSATKAGRKTEAGGRQFEVRI